MIGPALIVIAVSVVVGFFALAGISDQNERTRREFQEACAKVNGTPVWNKKYWECLK